MGKLLKYPLLILMLLTGAACHNADKDAKSKANDSEPTTQQYQSFSLFNMKGQKGSESENDVFVKLKNDTLIINTISPEFSKLTLLNKGDYWYSAAEYDMDLSQEFRDTYKYLVRPTRYDRFIIANTIYDYEQKYHSFYNPDYKPVKIEKKLIVKTREKLKLYDLGSDSIYETDPEAILAKIRGIIAGNDIHAVVETNTLIYTEMPIFGKSYGTGTEGGYESYRDKTLK